MSGNDLLIGDVFTNAATAVPDRTAAALGDRSLTFGALDARADQLAGALSRLGIGYRSRVALWSATTLDAVPLFAALAKVGAVFIPVNGLLGAEESVHGDEDGSDLGQGGKQWHGVERRGRPQGHPRPVADPEP